MKEMRGLIANIAGWIAVFGVLNLLVTGGDFNADLIVLPALIWLLCRPLITLLAVAAALD